MNDFLRELCAWLDENRFGRKVLFCKSPSTGNHLFRMAARHGTPVVNTRAASVRGYMNELAEPTLMESGLWRIDHVTAAIGLREIMERVSDAFQTQGVVELMTAESVLSQLEQLEECDIAPDRLEAVGEPLLARVWREYADWRRQNGYASLRQLVEAAALPADTQYALISNLPLTPIERAFLDRIPAGCLTIVHMGTPAGETIPRNAVYQAAIPPVSASGRPECVVCQDIGAEIRAALQRLPEKGIPAEETVIVCPDQSYGMRVEEEGKLLGIRVSSAFGIPATMTKTALLIRCLLDWAHRNYDAEALSPALISGGMALYDEWRELRLRGQELLRIFRSRFVGWGPDRWMRLAEAEKGRHAAAGRTMAAWVALFEAGDMPVREVALRLTELLRTCMPRGPENDLYLNIVDEISRIYKGDMSASAYLALVESIASGNSVGAETAEAPGRVYCCGYDSAVYVDRKHFILLGMSWDAMNRLGREFPLLHDDKKAALSPSLRLAADDARDRRYAVRELLLNRPDAQIVFSRAGFDHVGGEEILAASLFDDEAKRYDGTAPQVNILDRPPLTESDVHLRAGFSAHADPMEESPDRTALWAEAFRERIWTATGLEMACDCPRSFVLKAHMGMDREKPEALEQFSPAWLGAADRGTLLHEVLEGYYNATMPRVEEPDLPLLSRLMDSAVERLLERVPVPANLANVDEEIEDAMEIARREVARHAAEKGRGTVSVEAVFGADRPVELTFGPHTIRLTGRIDRVDLVDGEYEIIDYKSGSPYWFRQQIDRKLQYYLYTLAWEKLHPTQRIARATYELLDGVSDIERVCFDMTKATRDNMSARVTELLNLLADPQMAMISRPALDGAPDAEYENCPTYCPFVEICKANRWSEDLYDRQETVPESR